MCVWVLCVKPMFFTHKFSHPHFPNVLGHSFLPCL